MFTRGHHPRRWPIAAPCTCMTRTLQGQGNGGSYYRGRTFLGCDGSPITFEVRHGIPCLRVSIIRTAEFARKLLAWHSCWVESTLLLIFCCPSLCAPGHDGCHAGQRRVPGQLQVHRGRGARQGQAHEQRGHACAAAGRWTPCMEVRGCAKKGSGVGCPSSLTVHISAQAAQPMPLACAAPVPGAAVAAQVPFI